MIVDGHFASVSQLSRNSDGTQARYAAIAVTLDNDAARPGSFCCHRTSSHPWVMSRTTHVSGISGSLALLR